MSAFEGFGFGLVFAGIVIVWLAMIYHAMTGEQ